MPRQRARERFSTRTRGTDGDQALRLHFQKIADHLMTTFGQDRFRVELHALYGQGAMAQTHNNGAARPAGAVGFRGAGSDLQILRQRLLCHDERVVSRAGKRSWKAGEDPLSIVVNFAGLAMHQAVRANYLAPESFANRLVAETNTQYWRLPRHLLD